MSRAVKLFLFAAIAAMTLVFAAFAWRYWDAISQMSTLNEADKRRLIGALLATAFCPVWVGFGGFFVARQLAQPGLQLADRHRRFYEASLVIVVLFIAAIQLWVAFGAAYPPLAERGVLLRAVLVFSGLFTVIYGNFNAKAPPPSGDEAPAPADWVRGMLRNGWAMVLLGLAEVILALALPSRLLPMVVLAMLLPTLLIVRSQGRLMWPGRPRLTR